MIYLYGASGHAKVVAEILQSMQITDIKLFDDNKAGQLLDYKVLGALNIEESIKYPIIITIGNNNIRKSIAEKYSSANYAVGIHSSANISPRATVSAGTVIMAGVSINTDSVIGKHCILNTNCSIDHDSIIADFVHISPNAALAGNVEVGEGSHIGIGACVLQGVKIGKWVTIGAGAVILRDVPDYAVIVGNPGKIIKYSSTKQKI